MNFLIDMTKNPLFSFLAGLTGFLLGNYLAIGQAWRKEYNDSATDLFKKLHRQKSCIAAGNSVTRVEFDIFCRLLPSRKRKGYKKRVEEYYQATVENIRAQHNTYPLIAVIDKLLKYTERIVF